MIIFLRQGIVWNTSGIDLIQRSLVLELSVTFHMCDAYEMHKLVNVIHHRAGHTTKTRLRIST
jgi:hypothetical protein